MSETNEKMNGVKLPSGSVIQVINKNDSERIRNAFKLVDGIGDSTAKKLAAYVVRHKGEVLVGVVDSFLKQLYVDTEMCVKRNIKTMLGFPTWC